MLQIVGQGERFRDKPVQMLPRFAEGFRRRHAQRRRGRPGQQLGQLVDLLAEFTAVLYGALGGVLLLGLALAIFAALKISLIIELAAKRVPANLIGGMNSVHVDDVAEGHLAAAARGRSGERYILGGVNMTHTDTVAVVAEELRIRPPRFTCPPALVEPLAILADAVNPVLNLPANGDLLRLSRYYMYYDTSKAKAELGLGEPRPFRQAIREAIDWYRENGFLN